MTAVWEVLEAKYLAPVAKLKFLLTLQTLLCHTMYVEMYNLHEGGWFPDKLVT